MSAAFFLGAALALGHALQINNGFYNRIAVLWMTLALACAGAGVMLMRARPGLAPRTRAACRGLVAAGALWQLWELFTSDPGLSIPPGTSLVLFRSGVVAQGVVIAAGLGALPAARRVWFPALLALTLALGVWMVRAVPSPRIDVVLAHHEAIAALTGGRNPYEMTYPDIYGGPASGFYGPDAVVDGRVTLGFAYMPLTLLLAAPGQWLFGDYRYAEVVAFVLGAGLIGAAGRGAFSKAAAAILVTTPRLYFVLEQGWNEPAVVLLLGLAVWAIVRKPPLAALASALLLVTKQYVALAIITLGRTLGAVGALRGRRLWLALAAAIATVLPFFVWSPSAFFKGIVLLQFREPFRADSMSYLSVAYRVGLGDLPRVWSVLAAAVAMAIAAIAAPPTAAGVAASLALGCFGLFAFASKAFCNYYFFVVAALVAAAAATPEEERRT